MPLLRRMEEITVTQVQYGFWRIYILLRREGGQVNHKRVCRPKARVAPRPLRIV
jgi:putative transposase